MPALDTPMIKPASPASTHESQLSWSEEDKSNINNAIYVRKTMHCPIQVQILGGH